MENTRLNSQGSQIALTTRFQTMEFANLYIGYQTQVADGGRVDTALGNSTEQIAYTPDNRLLSTLDMGSAPAEGEAETDPTAQTQPEEQMQKKGCKSLVAFPAVLIAIAACAVVCSKKKH